MWIARWVPYADCSNTEREPPGLSECNSVLNKLPASRIVETFGALGTENIDVPLPLKYSDRQSVPCSSCYISSSTDPSYSEFCLHNRSIDHWTANQG